MAPESNPVLLYVSTTEALAAWPLVDLRLVCAWSAPHVWLICAWSALKAPGVGFSSLKALLALLCIYYRIAMDLCFLSFSNIVRKRPCAAVCYDH